MVESQTGALKEGLVRTRTHCRLVEAELGPRDGVDERQDEFEELEDPNCQRQAPRRRRKFSCCPSRAR